MNVDHEWERIDASLIRMRRLLDVPRQVEGGVDLSAVFVVDTVSRRAKDGMSTRIADIAHHLSVKPSTASRLVASTEAAGYIQRSVSPDDPRSVALHLTPSGAELDRSARQFRTTFLRRATATWDEETVATFARLIDEFSRATGTENPATGYSSSRRSMSSPARSFSGRSGSASSGSEPVGPA